MRGAGFIIIGLVAALMACDGGSAGGPRQEPQLNWGPASVTLFDETQGLGEGGVVGDWFLCDNEACTELSDEGFRLGTDGKVSALQAPGAHLESGERYCELSTEMGRYKVDGETLELEFVDQRIRAHFEIRGDRIILSLLGPSGEARETITAKKIDPPRSSGSCRLEAIPAPTPDPPSTAPGG